MITRFSLSGLKTAVVTYIEQETAAGRTIHLPDLAASFEAAVFDVQFKKAWDALKQTGAREYCLGGGRGGQPAPAPDARRQTRPAAVSA